MGPENDSVEPVYGLVMSTTSVRLSLPLKDRALLADLARGGDRTLSATVRQLIRAEAQRQGITPTTTATGRRAADARPARVPTPRGSYQ